MAGSDERTEREFARLRLRMVEGQIASRDVGDSRVLDAMAAVPRHLFVPAELRRAAYDDSPLPIGLGQTISQPYIVALMSLLAELRGGEKVLEVGTGSGYQAAVLSYLCGTVHTIERLHPLAERARSVLSSLGRDNVTVHEGDGSLGLPEEAPFDAVVVTAAPPEVPPALLEQLAEGGRLVIPVGPQGWQVLEQWRKEGGRALCRKVIPVAFVPLVVDAYP